MTENIKESQVVAEDLATVEVRRAWTRPAIYQTSASGAESSTHANADASINS